MRRLHKLLFTICGLVVLHALAATMAQAHTLPVDAPASSESGASNPLPGTTEEVSELRCRGGDNPLVDIYVIDKIDADTLSINFNASSRAAGSDNKGLDPGTCSWIDRTVKEDEWRQIHFKGTDAQVETLPAYLKNPKNYWSFFVVSTDRGYFEAKNHGAWTAGTKDATPTKEATAGTPLPAESQPSTPTASLAGKWNLLAGLCGSPFTLSLQQTGSKVTGSFSPQNGTIEGTATGKRLSFQWTQAGGYKGSGHLDMNSDGKSMSGVFTIVEGPRKGDNTVSATRADDAPRSTP